MCEISAMEKSHDGQILESLLEELGIKKSVLVEGLHKHPNTITKIFQKKEIPSDQLISIGRVIRCDLTTLFPKLKKIPEAVELMANPTNVVEEGGIEYKSLNKEIGELRIEKKYLLEQIENLKEIIENKNLIIEMKDNTISALKNSTK